jgi:hypothetical protein
MINAIPGFLSYICSGGPQTNPVKNQEPRALLLHPIILTLGASFALYSTYQWATSSVKDLTDSNGTEAADAPLPPLQPLEFKFKSITIATQALQPEVGQSQDVKVPIKQFSSVLKDNNKVEESGKKGVSFNPSVSVRVVGVEKERLTLSNDPTLEEEKSLKRFETSKLVFSKVMHAINPTARRNSETKKWERDEPPTVSEKVQNTQPFLTLVREVADRIIIHYATIKKAHLIETRQFILDIVESRLSAFMKKKYDEYPGISVDDIEAVTAAAKKAAINIGSDAHLLNMLDKS